MLGADGVLRAMWWDTNNALQSNALAMRQNSTSPISVTDCVGDCMTSGLWFEGTGTGLWLEMESGSGSGFGFAFDATSNNIQLALPPLRFSA